MKLVVAVGWSGRLGAAALVGQEGLAETQARGTAAGRGEDWRRFRVSARAREVRLGL